jgi:glycosyltransferase involved in cell wall biosynthesis
MRRIASDRVVFTGYAFGNDYAQLSRNCLFYVLASGVDGTRPVLLDQMGFGNCVLVRNSAANSEVVGEAGAKFDSERELDSLTEQMRHLIAHPEVVEEYRRKAVARVRDAYDWDRVTDRYIELFAKLLAGR